MYCPVYIPSPSHATSAQKFVVSLLNSRVAGNILDVAQVRVSVNYDRFVKKVVKVLLYLGVPSFGCVIVVSLNHL